MMSAIEKMRMLDRQNGGKEKERLEDWDGGEKGDWESVNFPGGGLGRGYSTLSKRLGQVRTGDWGMSSGKKKPSSLRGVVL
jgi:WD repeat-containing protein 59